MTTYSPFELEPIFIDFKNESYNLGLDIQANQNDTLTLNFICRNNGIEEDMSKYKVELRVHNNNTNTDYIQTQNENVTLSADGSVKIVCQSLKGNKLTAYSGQCNGVLRIFNTENKQKATRIITMRIISDPLETDRANICESTITKLEDLDWILNEAYNIEDEFKKAIQEAIKQKADLTAKISESVTAKNNLNSTIQTANNTNKTLNATNTTAVNTKNELNTLNNNAINTKSNLDKSNAVALVTNKTLSDTNTGANNTNNTLKLTISDADKSKSNLDTSKINADKSKIALDTSKSNADKSKTDLDGSIATGATLKNDIDNRIVTGNKLKTDIDNSSTVAITKKEQLDGANVQAEKNIETLNSFGDASQLTKDVTTLKTKVLENTLTSIETDSTLTKLDNCENGFVRNMQIRGRTLQNISIENNFTVEVPKTDFALVAKKLAFSLSPNKTYTISFDAENTGQKNAFSSIVLGKGDSDSWSFRLSNSEGFKNGKWVKTFTVPSNFQDTLNSKINFIFESKDCEGKIIIKNIMLLEGEPKEIPPFFEGIKSTGELEGNKISILSHGKNLVNMLNIKDNSGLVKVNEKTKNKVVLEQIANREYARAYMDVHFKANTKYTLTGKILNENTCLRVHELDKNVDYAILTKTGSVTFTTSNDTKLQLLFYTSYEATENSGKIAEFENIQIEEGTIATQYEDYKDDKTEILIPLPHCGLPDGVADIIDVDKSERIKNVAKVVLNGDENGWVKFGTNGIQGFKLADSNISQNTFTCLSDNIEALDHNNWFKSNETSIASSYGAIYLKFKGITELNEMKTKLKANPVTIYYQLAEPITEKLNIKDKLQSFENGYIQLDNAITPFTSLEYSTNIPSALGGLTQITDKLVDEVTNVEITISDMDAEIGEARKGKTTLEERLEEDRTNILSKVNECAKKKESIIYKQTFSGSEDLNNIVENGIYQIADATHMSNIPNANNKSWSILEVLASNTYIRQIYSSSVSGATFIRTRTENTWSEWKELATVDDTGWITLPLIPPLVGYGDNVIPKYRKINNIVEVRGAIKGLKTVNSNSGLNFAILPVGFRPKHTLGVVCQGLSLSKWYLNISDNGNLNIDRYSENGSTLKTEFSGLEWLPFQIMFSVD